MSTFETSTTVGGQGEIHVAGVPFLPGTEVEVTISPKITDASPSSETGDRVGPLLAALARHARYGASERVLDKDGEISVHILYQITTVDVSSEDEAVAKNGIYTSEQVSDKIESQKKSRVEGLGSSAWSEPRLGIHAPNFVFQDHQS